MDETEIKEMLDSILEAVKKIVDAIKKLFNDIFNCYIRLRNAHKVDSKKNRGTPPREYGISLFNHRRKEPHHVTYRCVKKVQRNLPYQRRQY